MEPVAAGNATAAVVEPYALRWQSFREEEEQTYPVPLEVPCPVSALDPEGVEQSPCQGWVVAGDCRIIFSIRNKNNKLSLAKIYEIMLKRILIVYIDKTQGHQEMSNESLDFFQISEIDQNVEITNQPFCPTRIDVPRWRLLLQRHVSHGIIHLIHLLLRLVRLLLRCCGSTKSRSGWRRWRSETTRYSTGRCWSAKARSLLLRTGRCGWWWSTKSASRHCWLSRWRSSKALVRRRRKIGHLNVSNVKLATCPSNSTARIFERSSRIVVCGKERYRATCSRVSQYRHTSIIISRTNNEPNVCAMVALSSARDVDKN